MPIFITDVQYTWNINLSISKALKDQKYSLCNLSPSKISMASPPHLLMLFGKHCFTYVCHKWQSCVYDFWDMEHNRQNFLSSWAFFNFCLPKSPVNQNFQKMKKIPGDIFLHMCTINHNDSIVSIFHHHKNELKKWKICTAFPNKFTIKN